MTVDAEAGDDGLHVAPDAVRQLLVEPMEHLDLLALEDGVEAVAHPCRREQPGLAVGEEGGDIGKAGVARAVGGLDACGEKEGTGILPA